MTDAAINLKSSAEMFDAMMKINPANPAKTPDSMFARLPIGGKPKETKEMPLGRNIVISGPPKSGKSSSTMDARDQLALDFENRLGYLDVARLSPIAKPQGVDLSQFEYPFNILLDQVKRGERLTFLCDWLTEVGKTLKADAGQSIRTTNFDTVDTLLHHSIYAHAYDLKHTTPYQKDYQEVYSKLLPILESFMRLNCDVIFQCHTEEMGMGADHKVWLSLTPKVREVITARADMILYLYQPDPNGLNRFYCHSKEGLPSGDGTGKLPVDLPATMNAIYACWTGEDPEKYQPQVSRWKTENIPVAKPPEKRKKAPVAE